MKQRNWPNDVRNRISCWEQWVQQKWLIYCSAPPKNDPNKQSTKRWFEIWWFLSLCLKMKILNPKSWRWMEDDQVRNVNFPGCSHIQMVTLPKTNSKRSENWYIYIYINSQKETRKYSNHPFSGAFAVSFREVICNMFFFTIPGVAMNWWNAWHRRLHNSGKNEDENMEAYVPGSKPPLFPYNRGWSSQPKSVGVYRAPL